MTGRNWVLWGEVAVWLLTTAGVMLLPTVLDFLDEHHSQFAAVLDRLLELVYQQELT